MFIGVSGLIGAGKTTLTKKLAEKLGYKALFEPVETNEYLNDFYGYIAHFEEINNLFDELKKNNRGHLIKYLQSGIPAIMQMHLLAKRYILHQHALFPDADGIVQDRTVYEDTIFAKMLSKSGFIDTRDYKTYKLLFQAMKHTLMYPDIIVYLNVKPSVAFNRIRARQDEKKKMSDNSRECEVAISLEYLEDLYCHYNEFINKIEKWTRVFNVDWNEYGDIDELAKKIINLSEYDDEFLRSIVRI